MYTKPLQINYFKANDEETKKKHSKIFYLMWVQWNVRSQMQRNSISILKTNYDHKMQLNADRRNVKTDLFVNSHDCVCIFLSRTFMTVKRNIKFEFTILIFLWDENIVSRSFQIGRIEIADKFACFNGIK